MKFPAIISNDMGKRRKKGALAGIPDHFDGFAILISATTHSSVLAWRIPGTGEPGGLPSVGSHRVRHD